ncbi:MAG: hypothetical protein ACO1NW_13345 [Chitinophagaceae bacterium]
MKKYIAGICAISMLAFTSCSKENNEVPETVTGETISGEGVTVSAWNTVGKWDENEEEQDGNVSTQFSVAEVSDSILQDGLVLVYARSGNSVQLLPFTDRNNTQWYYQAAAGGIFLMGLNAEEGKTSTDTPSFSYVVLSREKILQMESLGKRKLDLMNMSYDALVNLLRQ